MQRMNHRKTVDAIFMILEITAWGGLIYLAWQLLASMS
jgi:hypothetical protein